jgi:Ca2+-binding EF-hand superfamily protein
VISRERANGTFDINYDDGERELGVDRDLVRLKDVVDDRYPSSPSRSAAGRLEEGAKVEGNYRGRGKWYPGVISRERANGTFDVNYDDGERELGVDRDLVRLKDAPVDRYDDRDRRDLDRTSTSRHNENDRYDDRDRDRRDRDRDTRGPGQEYDRRDWEDKDRDRNHQSRHDDDDIPMDCIVSPRVTKAIRRAAVDFQTKNADVTLRKIFEAREGGLEGGDDGAATRGSTGRSAGRSGRFGLSFGRSSAAANTGSCGSLTKREFKACLKTMYEGSQASHQGRGYNNSRNLRDGDEDDFESWLPARELSNLMDALAYGKDGTIAYDDFIQYALSPEESEKVNVMDIHSNLQKYCTKNKLKSKDLARYFSTSRTIKNGYITVADFEGVLVRKMKVSQSDYDALVKRWDWNDDGTVDHNNFISWLFSGYNTEELASRYAHQLSKFEMAHATRTAERMAGKGGTLNKDDFMELCCKELGLVFSACELSCFFSLLDDGDKDRVSVDDVLSYHKNKDGGARRKTNSKSTGPTLKEDDALLPRMLREDLREAVLDFMKKADDGAGSIGKLMITSSSSATSSSSTSRLTRGNANAGVHIFDVTLTRRDFRKLLGELSLKMREEEENTVFESFDFNGDGAISTSDLLAYFMGLAGDTDSMEISGCFKDLDLGKKLLPKDLARQMAKADVQNTGLVEDSTLDKVLKKLCGSAAVPDLVGDIKAFFDPGNSGLVDRHYVAAVAAGCNPENAAVAEKKLRNSMRVLRLKNVDYKSIISGFAEGGGADEEKEDDGDSSSRRRRGDDRSSSSSDKGPHMVVDDLLDLLEVSFGMPLLRCELILVLGKFARRGKVSVEAFFEDMESEDLNKDGADASSHHHSKGDAESFGKTLFKKLCVVRSARDDSAKQLRKSLLDHDRDGVGKVSKRDLQRVLDRHASFTDPEAALLEENLLIVESNEGRTSSAGYVDYPLLLLLLKEPIAKVAEVVTAGTSFLNKVTRSSGNNKEAVRRIFQLLYRNFSSSDRDLHGVITMDAAEDVIKQEVPTLDDNIIDTLFDAFADADSNDCLCYPELWSFLIQCHEQSVMARLAALDAVRHKQGYSTGDALSKLNKKKKKVDKSTTSTIFVNLGVLMSECALHTVFGAYSSDKAKSVLHVDHFIEALEGGNDEDVNDFSPAALRRRKEAEQAGGGRGIRAFTARDGGVSKCEISSQILSEYDAKLTRMAQLAFDMFDTENNNTINSSELERVMCALGYEVDYVELDDLLDEIDKKDKGYLEYHAFMNGVLKFVRDKYATIVTRTEARIKEFFDHLDTDRSGCLDRAEFIHITDALHADLGAEEMDAILEYLDKDESGTVTKTEFGHLCALFNDDRTVNSLTRVLRSAIRKIQFSTLPDPRKYITMFSGLPVNYRKSVLGAVEADESTRIENIMTTPVSPAPDSTFDEHMKDKVGDTGRRAGAKLSRGTEAELSELHFEVGVSKVEGIPCEDVSRTPDVVSRGVRFCVVQTDKPPHPEQGPGNPPAFLSNVTKLEATTHETKRDIWNFKRAESAEKTCFVRCSATHGYEHPEDTTGAAASAGGGRGRRNRGDPTDELYLFMELTMTLKCNPNVSVGRKGVVSNRDKKGGRDHKDSRDSRSYKDDPKGKGKDTTENSGGIYSRFFGGEKKDEKKSSGRRGRNNTTSGRDSDDHSDDESPERDSSPGRSNSPRRERDRRDDRRGDDSVDDLNPVDHNTDDLPTVEMTCGWVMVPIASSIVAAKGGTLKLTLDLSGGSPFSIVDVDQIKHRPGTLGTMRRLLGVKVKPRISFSINCIATPVGTDQQAHRGPVMDGSFNSTSVPVYRENGALMNTFNAMNFHDSLTRSLFSLLPPNVVVPSKAVLLVGVFRNLLDLTMHSTVVSHGERLLPQSAPAQRGDILLSAFPQILADRAAMEALLLVWALEVSPSLWKRGVHSITSNDLESEKVRTAFRDCVVRVWRAYNSPDARKNRLNPQETVSELRARKTNILAMLGFEIKNKCIYPLDPPGGRKQAIANGFNEDGGLEVKRIANRKEGDKGLLALLGSPGDQVHVPFNTVELHASRRVHIDQLVYVPQ